MTTYCAPCLADLALVRDAVTSVNGTAACVAHAVLLTHPGDSPQRRLNRLTELRSMAEGKLATASTEDVPAIELLVQEYALAGAMDMTVPLKDLAGERAPRPPKSRRERGRGGRERGPRPEFPVETRTADGGASEEGAATAAPTEGAPARSDSAPARPDVSAGPDVSEAQSAGATSASDSSPTPPAPRPPAPAPAAAASEATPAAPAPAAPASEPRPSEPAPSAAAPAEPRPAEPAAEPRPSEAPVAE